MPFDLNLGAINKLYHCERARGNVVVVYNRQCIPTGCALSYLFAMTGMGCIPVKWLQFYGLTRFLVKSIDNQYNNCKIREIVLTMLTLFCHSEVFLTLQTDFGLQTPDFGLNPQCASNQFNPVPISTSMGTLVLMAFLMFSTMMGFSFSISWLGTSKTNSSCTCMVMRASSFWAFISR